MSFTSIAFFSISTNGTSAIPSSKVVTPALATAAPETESSDKADGSAARRPHPLLHAILSALKEMRQTTASAPAEGPAPEPADPTAPASDAATPTADSVASAADSKNARVQEAVVAFVDALAQALRGAAGGAPAGTAAGDSSQTRTGAIEQGPAHRHPFARHEIRQERREERRADRDGAQVYSGLADRLTALAATASTSTASTASTTEAASAARPLVDAFKGVLDALKANPDAATPLKNVPERLAAFLHRVAQAMQPLDGAAARLQPGALVDVSA